MSDPSSYPDDAHSDLKLAKNLYSPHKMKREKAMSLLCLWLTSQKEIKEEELLKIWKGLFYCVSHAEKAPAQTDLIDRMAFILEKLDVDLSVMFFKAFLRALRNEIAVADSNHLHSFYLLLNHYISHMFAVLKNSTWNSNVVRKFMDALLERSFLSQDGPETETINVHIVQVFLSELDCYLPVPIEAFEILLEPFYTALEKGCSKEMAVQISSKVFITIHQYCVNALEKNSDQIPLDNRDAYFATIIPSLRISDRIQAISAIRESNSDIVKELYEKFLSLEASLSESGISENLLETELGNGSAAPAQDTFISPPNSNSFKTFGRRSKRNQKVDFSPYVDGSSLEQEIETYAVVEEPDNATDLDMLAIQNDTEMLNCDPPEDIAMEDNIILNLAKRFDSIADGSDELIPVVSVPLAPSPVNTGSKKRKSVRFSSVAFATVESPTSTKENNILSPANSASGESLSAKKSKKVHFSLQHNIVWKPSTPLPPHNVRVPPAATPRGSALKKGVPPGPVINMKTVSPKKKRRATPRKPTSTTKSPRSPKNAARLSKAVPKGSSSLR